MLLFLSIFLIFLLFLFICSRKLNVADYLSKNKKPLCLIRMSLLIYILLRQRHWPMTGCCCLPGYLSVANDLKYLNPVEEQNQQRAYYYVNKISKMILCMFVSIVLCFAFLLCGLIKGESESQHSIHRNTYGEEEKRAVLVASTGEEEIDVQITVRERRYTLEEFQYLASELESSIQELLHVSNGKAELWNSIVLPTQIKGYPFDIKWFSTQQDILSNHGSIQYQNLVSEGQWITLCMTIQYYDYAENHEYEVYIHNHNQENDVDLESQILNELENREELSIYEEELTLPEYIGNQKITWSKKKRSSSYMILLLLVPIILIYFLEDRNMIHQVNKKREKLKYAYPEFVSKMTLLLSAGMTTRKAWEKMIVDEIQSGKAAVNSELLLEMRLTLHEMSDGIAEAKAYINFGKRCGLRSYQRFSTLITQNMKHGTARLIEELLQESRNSFEERKRSARKKGEEAGTKLLLPMLLLLVIVIVIVMVPAFMSF